MCVCVCVCVCVGGWAGGWACVCVRACARGRVGGRACVCVRARGWAGACTGGVRFSNSNRIIPSDYRILLLLKMPIPNNNIAIKQYCYIMLIQVIFTMFKYIY